MQIFDCLLFYFFDRKPGRSLAGEKEGMLTRVCYYFDSLPDVLQPVLGSRFVWEAIRGEPEGSGEESFLSRPTPLATFQSFFASFPC